MKARLACAGCAALLIAVSFAQLHPAAAFSSEPMLSPGAMLPFAGVRASTPLWRWVSHVPFAHAALAWEAIFVFALLGLIAGAALFARVRGLFDIVCVALAALAFAPVASALTTGATVIVAAAAAALAAGLRTLPALGAGSFLAFAVQPNAALGLFASVRRGGAPALAFAFAAIYLGNALIAGFAWPLFYARTLVALARSEGGSVLQFTPAAIAQGLGAPPLLAAAIGVALGLAAAAAAVTVALRARDDCSGFVAGCCALPFVCGFFHAAGFSALFAASIASLRGRSPGAALCAVIALGANWQAPLLGLALIAACLALAPRIEIRTLAGAAAGALILTFGSWLAIAHPLHEWTDAVRSLSLPANANSAALWHIELAHSGLLGAHPANALLRLLALGGCALLLATAARTSDVDVHHVVERRDAVGMEVL
ncbi:MAG TPA: hypothetical protein VMA98_02080 [Candidatus Acidoferrales bacterium]|nr:hypothetical protein [Candidatus Acidoferrales bacterium]